MNRAQGMNLARGMNRARGDEPSSVLEPSTGLESGCLIELAIRPFSEVLRRTSEVYAGPQKLRRTSEVAQDLGSYARPLKLRRTLEVTQDLGRYAGPRKCSINSVHHCWLMPTQCVQSERVCWDGRLMMPLWCTSLVCRCWHVLEV